MVAVKVRESCRPVDPSVHAAYSPRRRWYRSTDEMVIKTELDVFSEYR